MAVNAFISPPTASMAVAISSALRVVVPLNSRCSRKCDEPATAGLLVPGADADPDAEGRREDAGHRLGQDPQAAGQLGALHPAADLVEVEQLGGPDGNRGGRMQHPPRFP